MNQTPKPVPSPRKSRAAVAASANHTCVECPACGTETCKTLQDLGMYCDTAVAAFQAMGGERRGKRKLAVL